MQSLNLIPQEELQEQNKEKAVKVSTLFSIFILVVTVLVSGYFFYTSYQLNTEIEANNKTAEELRSKIKARADVEINARNLDKKFTLLREIFANRTSFSMLATEVSQRKPAGVSIDSMNLQKTNKLNISGKADNYLSIAEFTSNLVNTEFKNGDPTLKKLFTEVTLNSVSLEQNKNSVRFSVNVDIDTSLLGTKK